MNDRMDVDMKQESEKAELLNDVRISMKQIDEGHVFSNPEAKEALWKRLTD